MRNRLSDLVCEKIQAICADNKRRLEATDASLLSRGVFYPQEYFKALQATGQYERIEELRNSDCFFNGYAPAEYFEIDLNPSSITGKKAYCFTLKKGANPAEAIQMMAEGLSLIECLGVSHLVQYLAIRELIGIEKFNLLFAGDSATPLTIGTLRPQNPLYRLITSLNVVNPSLSIMERGDLVYFRNKDVYLAKHVDGTAQGFNTFCIDDSWGRQKYAALGFKPEGLREKEIIGTLIEELNLPPDNLDYLSTKTKEAFCKSFENKHTDFQIDPEECNRLWNWQFTLLSRLNAERITALANSTLAEAQALWKDFPKSDGRPF